MNSVEITSDDMTTNGDELNDDETDYDFLIEKTFFLNGSDDDDAIANDCADVNVNDSDDLPKEHSERCLSLPLLEHDKII